MTMFFYFSVLLLAVMLYFPTSRLIWVMSVRRIQRKSGKAPAQSEIAGQESRARFISVLVVLIFSWFFNLSLLGVNQ